MVKNSSIWTLEQSAIELIMDGIRCAAARVLVGCGVHSSPCHRMLPLLSLYNVLMDFFFVEDFSVAFVTALIEVRKSIDKLMCESRFVTPSLHHWFWVLACRLMLYWRWSIQSTCPTSKPCWSGPMFSIYLVASTWVDYVNQVGTKISDGVWFRFSIWGVFFLSVVFW